MPAIGFQSFQLDDVAYLVDGEGKKAGNDVLLASGQSSNLTPAHRIPPGTVVVKRTSTGKYVFANDANGDRCAAAAVTSIIAPGATWASKIITTTVNGKAAAVTLAGTDDTIGEVVTALNADAIFKQIAVASDAGASDFLTVTTLEKGADVQLKVSMNLDTAFATDTGTDSEAEANGTDADYRVTGWWGELKDINAAAQDYMVPTLIAGKFRESVLGKDSASVSTLTAEAKRVLIRNGSRFE